MRKFKGIRYEIRRMSGAYAIFCFLLFIANYFSIKRLVFLFNPDYRIGVTDVLYRFFQAPSLSLIVSPMFAVLCIGLITREKDDSYITRFESRVNYWRQLSVSLLFHSFVFIVLTLGVTLLAASFNILLENYWTSNEGFIYRNIKNTQLVDVWKNESWRFSTPVVLVMSILMGWASYWATGMTLLVLYMLANSRVIAFILLILISISDTYLSFVSVLYRFSFFYLTYWFDWKSFIASITYLIVLSIIMYLIGKYFVNRRDYLALRRWNVDDK